MAAPGGSVLLRTGRGDGSARRREAAARVQHLPPDEFTYYVPTPWWRWHRRTPSAPARCSSATFLPAPFSGVPW